MNMLKKIRKAFDLKKVLKNSQTDRDTSKLSSISREFAGHPSAGLTPAKLVNILKQAELGNLTAQCDLFEDIEEKDGHIFAELSKRKRALLTLPWDIVPPANASAAERQQAEQVKEWIAAIPDLEDHLFDIADAIGKGYSLLEISWQNHDNVFLPILKSKPARIFTTAQNESDATKFKDPANTILLRTQSNVNEELWPLGWIVHIHKAKSGSLARSGLHRILTWSYLFKNYSVRDLAEFLEIYGIPARIGQYPPGAGDDEKMTLLRAVTSIGHHAAGIMPEGMAIDFKEAAKGQSDPFQTMIDWCENTQSKAILGGTLTSTASNTGLGSNQSDVHNEVRHDLLVSDARQIASTLTRDLISALAFINIKNADLNRLPHFKFLTDEEEDLKVRVERDKILFDMGFRLTEDKVKEIYGEGYEYIPVMNEKNAAALKQDIAITAAQQLDPKPTELDGFINQLTDKTQGMIDDRLIKIKALLATAKNFEDFQEKILANFISNTDPDELTGIMRQALAASELAGMYDVSEGEA